MAFRRSDLQEAFFVPGTAAPPSPAKRSRGRPVGSRSRRNGAMTTMSVN